MSNKNQGILRRVQWATEAWESIDQLPLWGKILVIILGGFWIVFPDLIPFPVDDLALLTVIAKILHLHLVFVAIWNGIKKAFNAYVALWTKVDEWLGFVEKTDHEGKRRGEG